MAAQLSANMPGRWRATPRPQSRPWSRTDTPETAAWALCLSGVRMMRPAALFARETSRPAGRRA